MEDIEYLTDEKGRRIITNSDGLKLAIDVLFSFKIPELGKEYIAYNICEPDDVDPNSDVMVLVSEVIRDGDTDEIVEILDVRDEEHRLVREILNDIMQQIGGK